MTTLTRRRLLALAGTALGGAVLASCGGGGGGQGGGGTGGGGSNQKATISFWDTNAGPDRTPIWNELITRFQKAHPNITVKYVGLPESQLEQKLQAAIASGAVPDVANASTTYIAALAAQNGLLPLDKHFSSWPERKNFSSDAINSIRQLVPDHKLYGLPLSGNTDTLYYRKDWFTQKGLPEPTTWDAFYKAATALTNPSGNVYGFGLRGGAGSVSLLQSWIFAESGITSYFDSKGKSTFDKPASVAVIKKAASLYGHQSSKDDINHAYREMVAEFDSGHAAMIFHNLGSYPQHVQALGKDAFGALPMPAMSGGKHIMQSSGYILSQVFKGSKHPDAAFTFAAYLASASASGYFNQQIGQLPVNEADRNASWIKENGAIQSALATIADKRTVMVDTPFYLPDLGSIQTEMVPSFQKVLLGQTSAQAFASDLADRYTKARQQYKKATK